MKPASVADTWRRIRETRSRQLVGVHVQWRGIAKLTDGELVIGKPFVLLCGENGAGKSTILNRLLHALVPFERRAEVSVHVRQEEGEIEVLRVELGHGPGITPQVLVDKGAILDYFAPEGEALRVALFDPAMHVPIMLKAIERDADFSEVIEPISPRAFDTGEVRDVSFLVGKSYDSVLAYEIEGVPGIGLFPYFQVEVSGARYSSEQMGFGELALLLGYWLLLRMPKGSLVLMEEPETFVSPRSQRRFADISARFVLERNLIVVATTHSPSIVSRFNREEITLVSRTIHDVSLHTPAPRAALERRLELVQERRQVWYVEDAVAARVASYFSEMCPLPVDIFLAENNDGVVNAVASVKPATTSAISFVGLLDGDERRRRVPIPPSTGFLPSDDPPDKFIHKLICQAPRDSLASLLGVSRSSLELALASSAGEDHHQALHTLRSELGITLDYLVRGALRWWQESQPDEYADFVSGLTRLVESAADERPPN